MRTWHGESWNVSYGLHGRHDVRLQRAAATSEGARRQTRMIPLGLLTPIHYRKDHPVLGKRSPIGVADLRVEADGSRRRHIQSARHDLKEPAGREFAEHMKIVKAIRYGFVPGRCREPNLGAVVRKAMTEAVKQDGRRTGQRRGDVDVKHALHGR